MATPIKPAKKMANGNDSWGFVLAVADPLLPKLTELNAAGGFNLSCSVFSEQEGPTSTTNKVTLPRYICETDEYEVNGTTTHSMPDLMVSFDPQAASGADGKKAWETMTDGISGFLWRRQSVKATTDLSTGQFVDVIPVTLGTKTPSKTGTGPEGVYAFTQPVSITGAPAYNKAIVAGP